MQTPFILSLQRLLVKKNGGYVENNRFFFLKTKFFVDKWVDLFIFYSKTPQKREEKRVKNGWLWISFDYPQLIFQNCG